MLVLTRKTGEQLIIADEIRVTVVSVGPGRVKIGIEAPEWVKIDRQEIHEKKQADYSSESRPSLPKAQFAATPSRVPVPSNGHTVSGNGCADITTRANTHMTEPSEGPDQLENRLQRLSRLRRKPR